MNTIMEEEGDIFPNRVSVLKYFNFTTERKFSLLKHFLRKKIVFTPETPSFEDFLLIISNKDQLIKEILTNENSYSSFQLSIEIIFEKVESDGTTSYKEFYIKTKKRPLEKKYLNEFVNDIFDKSLNVEMEGSGHTIMGVKFLDVDYFAESRSIQSLGMYVELPRNLPGKKHLVNIKTKDKCVELSLYAHFYHKYNKTNLTLSEFDYKSFNHEKGFIKFPHLKDDFISIETFDKIEKYTNTDIYVYSILNVDSKKPQIKVIRKGKNPSINEERRIYLLSLPSINSDHICLIKDIQLFLKCLRRTKAINKKELTVGQFCPCCMSYVKNNKYDYHFIRCATSEALPNISMPEKDAKYKFKKMQALEMAPLVCYYDTESILRPLYDDNIHSHEHVIGAYCYSIVSKSGEIIKFRYKVRETLEENLSKNMIDNMFEDYQLALNQIKRKWFEKITISNDELQKFHLASKCEVCFNSFKNSHQKHKHHRWDEAPIYDKDNKLIKGNYIAALCATCNLQITLKKLNYRCLLIIQVHTTIILY